MSKFSVEQLNSVAKTYKNLHEGNPISNEDLKTSIEVYKEVTAFFKAVNDRKFDLVVDYIRQDLCTMESYAQARGLDLKKVDAIKPNINSNYSQWDNGSNFFQDH